MFLVNGEVEDDVDRMYVDRECVVVLGGIG